MKKIYKVFGYVLLGVLLLLGIIYLSQQWYYTAEDEVFVLPDGFEGAVIILFNEKNGQSEEYDNKGNRVYNIPGNGVLKTRFKFQEGWRDIKYEFKNGTHLEYLFPSSDVWNDTIIKKKNSDVYAFNASYSGDYWFLVGKIRDVDSLRTEMDKKWKLFPPPLQHDPIARICNPCL